MGVARIWARATDPARLRAAGSGRVAVNAHLDTHGSIVDVRLTAHDEGGGVLGAWRCARGDGSTRPAHRLRKSGGIPIGAEHVEVPSRKKNVKQRLRAWTTGSHRARGGAPSGALGPAMPPNKKGKGEDEAEACPADMDPEVWAVVKDVTQLVALASKRASAPPVTRFDALLHLWSAAASKPKERDALVAAGALNASLAASKPDVAFLDRAAGLGLGRALLLGAADASTPMNARNAETASDARFAASALDFLIENNSSRCVNDALAILLGLARNGGTRKKTVQEVAKRGSIAWRAIAECTRASNEDVVARRDAAFFLSLCARFGDAAADADAAAVENAGLAVASTLATHTNALEYLLDAVCGDRGDEDDEDDDERSPPERDVSDVELERARSLELRLEDARLAAAECLATCSRSDDAGDWLFHGFRAPRVARLVQAMRRKNQPSGDVSAALSNNRDAIFAMSEASRGAAATTLFNAVDRGNLARADASLRRALLEDAARASAEAGDGESRDEKDGEEDAEEAKVKKKPPRGNLPLDLRREKLPGGFGSAARQRLAETKTKTKTEANANTSVPSDPYNDDDDKKARANVAKTTERLFLLREAGGVAPIAALVSRSGAAHVDDSGLTRPSSPAGDTREPEPAFRFLSGERNASSRSVADETEARGADAPADARAGATNERPRDAAAEPDGAARVSPGDDDDDDDDDASTTSKNTTSLSVRGKTGRKGDGARGDGASKTPEDKRRDALRASLTLEGRRSAAGLTRYLVAVDARTSAAVIRVGGVHASVALLKSDDDETRRHAQAALWNVANIEMREEEEARKQKEKDESRKENVGVPRAHAEALRDAKAPGYVSKVLAYGDELEKLALRDTSDAG